MVNCARFVSKLPSPEFEPLRTASSSLQAAPPLKAPDEVPVISWRSEETARQSIYAKNSSRLPGPTIDREEGSNANEERMIYTEV